MTLPRQGVFSDYRGKVYPHSTFVCVECESLNSKTHNCILCRIFHRSAETASGCIEWTGCKTYNGYGRVLHQGRKWIVHLIILEILGIDVPDGMEVDHLCKNRPCFNPRHLEVVKPIVNFMRGENICRLNLNKEKCPKGHPYDIVRMRDGRKGRECSICRKEYRRAYRARLRSRQQ